MDSLTLCQGLSIELWLLKVFWGGLYAKALGANGIPIRDIKADVDVRTLYDILWRAGQWPDGWGLHCARHDVDPRGLVNSVGLQALTGPDGSLWGGSVTIGALQLSLGLGKINVNSDRVAYRPGAVIFERAKAAEEKLLALAWPEPGHLPVSYTRAE